MLAAILFTVALVICGFTKSAVRGVKGRLKTDGEYKCMKCKNLKTVKVEGKRSRGRGRKTWRECVVED